VEKDFEASKGEKLKEEGKLLFPAKSRRALNPAAPAWTSFGSWPLNGQLTPMLAGSQYLLSLPVSSGPAPPYSSNSLNPELAGDIYHSLHKYEQPPSKPLTPKPFHCATCDKVRARRPLKAWSADIVAALQQEVRLGTT
jgi:hypothetical protein